MVQAFRDLEAAAGGSGSLTASVKVATKMCLQHQKEYKMVVFEVERFLAKASEAAKMGGLYVVDLLCRKEATGKSKDNFCARFASRMKQIFAMLEGVSESNRLIVAKLVYQWRKRAVFPSDCMPRYDDLKEVIEGGSIATAKVDGQLAGAGAERGDIVIKAPEKPAPRAKATTKKGIAKKAIKFCAFREGSCPFGDKCRFSHVEPGVQGQYMITRGATAAKPVIAEDARDFFEYGPIDRQNLPSTKDVSAVGMVVNESAFPMKRKAEKAEGKYFKRHELTTNCYATQEFVKFSWMNSESFDTLITPPEA